MRLAKEVMGLLALPGRTSGLMQLLLHTHKYVQAKALANALGVRVT